MSKGSGRRPQLVSREEMDRRWEKAFGGDQGAGIPIEWRSREIVIPIEGPRSHPDEWAAIADEIMAVPQADGTP